MHIYEGVLAGTQAGQVVMAVGAAGAAAGTAYGLYRLDYERVPRVAVLRGMILNHILHHRGQLTIYLRLNDLPVPALYGPSADEGGM